MHLPSCLIIALLFTGCAEIEIRPNRDPRGGAITDSIAAVYDASPDRLWYVVFIHAEGLVVAQHRHSPGFHLFVRDGDLVFYSRCSGPGEVIDMMRQTFRLTEGAVFLCEVKDGEAKVVQLKLPPPTCRGDDPESVAGTLYELANDPRIAEFMRGEARARLLANWEKAKKRKLEVETKAR